jgi:glycosyltransferase involved in cell wall biosynthesis
MNSTAQIKLKAEKPLIVWQAHEGNLSGANMAMLEYIDALQLTYRSHVILPHEGGMCKALEERAVPVSIIPQYGWAGRIPFTAFGKWMKKNIRTLIAIRAVKQLLMETGAALVCTNTLVPFVAAKAAYKLCLPHVWCIHEYGEEDFGFSIGNGNPKWAYKKMQQWSRLVVANSKSIAKKFQQLMPAATVATVYQPVSWKETASIPALKAERFLMFGQIVASKGHKEVLQAMAKNKQQNKQLYTLHIKGPCENKVYLNELQYFVTQHGLEPYVEIEAGYFTKEEIIPLYDVLIVASNAEAFGRVIVEANKAGLYALVRNSGGAPELINETNGLLYSNEDELSDTLCGARSFPDKTIKLSYNESIEIQKLNALLYNACR